MIGASASAARIAAAVRARTVRAGDVVDGALARIERHNASLGAFTGIVATRARATAAALDARLARGEDAGPLAGVPFAVKNLFDVAGLPTRAGSKINRDRAGATRDAFLVRKLEAAGAVLVGALNMGEYAYDFTGENAHDGPSRNPHDLARMSGGSSGGSGSAVAGGLVPLALSSDTNGSIRVPSAFCGIFGLKPTYGRLGRGGTYPFVSALDHLGPMARSATDLALAYDAMQGADADDPACRPPRIEPTGNMLERGAQGLRIAVADDYFMRGAHPEALAAVEAVAKALGAARRVTLPEAARARAAAFVITGAEAGAFHRRQLAARAADYDPEVRSRLLAGAMIPAAFVDDAQRFRRWFHDRLLDVFKDVDVILAPSTPCLAPSLGQKTLTLDGVDMPLRANIGIFTQPISFIGLPVVAVPVFAGGGMPAGVQVIASPWREDLALRVAFDLQRSGTCAAPVPTPFQ